MGDLVKHTGQKVFSTLEQYNVLTGLATGVTKPNVDTDPDYIPPDESSDCPTYYTRGDSTCCFTAFAFGSGYIGIEFSGAACNITFPLTPTSYTASGLLIGYNWQWEFWQNGNLVHFGNGTISGFSTHVETIDVSGWGVGTIHAQVEYRWDDGAGLTFSKLLKFGASKQTIANLETNGFNWSGPFDCRTYGWDKVLFYNTLSFSNLEYKVIDFQSLAINFLSLANTPWYGTIPNAYGDLIGMFLSIELDATIWTDFSTLFLNYMKGGLVGNDYLDPIATDEHQRPLTGIRFVSSCYIPPTTTTTTESSFLLKEDGDKILQEDSSKIKY